MRWRSKVTGDSFILSGYKATFILENQEAKDGFKNLVFSGQYANRVTDKKPAIVHLENKPPMHPLDFIFLAPEHKDSLD